MAHKYGGRSKNTVGSGASEARTGDRIQSNERNGKRRGILPPKDRRGSVLKKRSTKGGDFEAAGMLKSVTARWVGSGKKVLNGVLKKKKRTGKELVCMRGKTVVKSWRKRVRGSRSGGTAGKKRHTIKWDWGGLLGILKRRERSLSAHWAGRALVAHASQLAPNHRQSPLYGDCRRPRPVYDIRTGCPLTRRP